MYQTNNPIIKNIKSGYLTLLKSFITYQKAGVSRDTFYRDQELVDEGGIDALINQNRRVPNVKNSVVNYAIEYPAHGQHRSSNELRKKGIFVSGSGVRSIWLRYNIENFTKRLKTLEDNIVTEGIILSESQVSALEKKAQADEAWVRLKQRIQVIWVHRTLFMLVI